MFSSLLRNTGALGKQLAMDDVLHFNTAMPISKRQCLVRRWQQNQRLEQDAQPQRTVLLPLSNMNLTGSVFL